MLFYFKKMKVGDKVSFINEKMNGIIKAIKADGLVAVEIEDDFIIDALAKELVVTEVFMSDKTAATEEPVPVTSLPKEFNLSTNEICFVAIPAEKHKTLTGYIGYYLVNGTDYELLFLIHSKKDTEWKKVASGTLKPRNAVNILTINRPDLTDISSFHIQLLISGGNNIHHPVQKEVSVLLPDLANANKNFPDFAAVASLVNFDQADDEELMQLSKKFQPEKKPNTSAQKVKTQKSTDTGAVLLNSKEVDLHIDQLTKEHRTMTNAEMLELQKSVVRKEMDHAIVNHFKKIVFIHGKGEGVLRNEVLKELSQYSNIKIQEADYARYGGGATEVLF